MELELRREFDDAVVEGVPAHYLVDRTEGRGLRGRADAVVLPRDAEECARIVAWCYERDIPIVPRGGGTGYAGGAVADGGVVLGLERMARVRSLEPEAWRIEVEAGVTTAEVRRRAREVGLLFPIDPGAAEQSQIGGNIATNAGGPHAFKYGVTGAWVLALEAVVAPGALVRLGSPLPKDVGQYDLRALLVGSEGTLGIVTAAWLRLVPAPEAALPVLASYGSVRAGCAAVQRVLAAGVGVSALEFLDAETMRYAGDDSGFTVVAEVDGSAGEVARLRAELLEVLGEDATGVRAPEAPEEVAALWRWRDGVSLRVAAQVGGKASEDIAVPVARLEEAIARTHEIGRRHGLPACAWGHAGDGNLHSSLLVAPEDDDGLRRAALAAEELLDLAAELGGSLSGEHGLGTVKRDASLRHTPPAVLELQRAVKRALDPKGLFNPGKRL